MNLRPLCIAAIISLIGTISLAEVSEQWGKGERQDDGTIVYKRMFVVSASHWEPNNITNYFVDFEYTKLHIGEGNKGKYFHVLWGSSSTKEEDRRELAIRRDETKRVTEMTLASGKYNYLDLNGDGKLDVFYDGTKDQTFIMTTNNMVRVIPKHTKDQDVQTSFEDKVIYRLHNGDWVRDETR